LLRNIWNDKLLYFKYNVEAEDFEALDVSQETDSDFGSLLPLKQAYAEWLSISIAKKCDVLGLLKKRIIPAVYKDN